MDSLTDSSQAGHNLHIFPGVAAERDSVSKEYIKEFEKVAKRKTNSVKVDVKAAKDEAGLSKRYI